MTKEEAVKAAAMGIPVVYLDPMGGRQIRYKRIASVIWQYATLDGRLPEKRVSVELLREDGSRGTDVYPIDRVEAANAEQWELQQDIGAAEGTETAETEKPKAKRTVFQKPKIGEVAAYAMEMQYYGMDAQAFMDHYDACGWVVGKDKPMRCWRAAVRNWVRRDGAFGGAKKEEPEQKQSSFDTDAFFEAALAKSYSEV